MLVQACRTFKNNFWLKNMFFLLFFFRKGIFCGKRRKGFFVENMALAENVGSRNIFYLNKKIEISEN